MVQILSEKINSSVKLKFNVFERQTLTKFEAFNGFGNSICSMRGFVLWQGGASVCSFQLTDFFFFAANFTSPDQLNR